MRDGDRYRFVGIPGGSVQFYTPGKIYVIEKSDKPEGPILRDDRGIPVPWYGPAVSDPSMGYWRKVTRIERKLPDWF